MVRYDFGTAGGKTKLINKQWFTEQVVLSLNTFSYSLYFVSDKNLPQLVLKIIGSPFTLGYN